jgi:hypothetical protein
MIHVEFGGALYWAIILLCIAALIHFLYSMAKENDIHNDEKVR